MAMISPVAVVTSALGNPACHQSDIGAAGALDHGEGLDDASDRTKQPEQRCDCRQHSYSTQTLAADAVSLGS